jgi:hypothetical protein
LAESDDFLDLQMNLDCRISDHVGKRALKTGTAETVKKGLLAQASPLDFPVHLHQPGNYVLVKTWKENKLEPAWEGPSLVLLTMETAVQTTEQGWTHYTQKL